MAKEEPKLELPIHNGQKEKQEQQPLSPSFLGNTDPTPAPAGAGTGAGAVQGIIRLSISKSVKRYLTLAVSFVFIHYFGSLFFAFPLATILRFIIPNPPLLPWCWDWIITSSSASGDDNRGGSFTILVGSIFRFMEKIPILPVKRKFFKDANFWDIAFCTLFFVGVGVDILWLIYWGLWTISRKLWTRIKPMAKRERTQQEQKPSAINIESKTTNKTMTETTMMTKAPAISDKEEETTGPMRIIKQIPEWWKPIILYYYLCTAEIFGKACGKLNGKFEDWWSKKQAATLESDHQTTTKKSTRRTRAIPIILERPTVLGIIAVTYIYLTVGWMLVCTFAFPFLMFYLIHLEFDR